MRLTNFETALLSRLRVDERSAYELQHIAYFHGFGSAIAGLAVFPILKRLEGDDLVRSRWIEDDQGRKVRVFAITRKGERAFVAL